jgi:type VI secretion system protein ImpK
MPDEMASLAHVILERGLELQERLARGERLSLEEEQASLKGLLLDDVEARRRPDYGGDRPAEPGGAAGAPRRGVFLGARYALVCWLDELFVFDSPWGAPWNEAKLEGALYGSNDRAWRFWEQAALAEARPSAGLTEVFFLCVMLGFRGELREDPDRLRAWVAAVQARMGRDGEPAGPSPSRLDPPTAVPPLRGRDRLRRMVVSAGLVLLVLLPLLAFLVARRLAS